MADENEESYVEVSDNEEILSDVDEDDDENSFDSDLINDTNDDKKTTTLFNENDDSETVSSDELSDTDDEFSESEIDPQKLLDYKEESYLQEMHSELQNYNDDEVKTLTTIIKNENGIIVDPLHKTVPFLTKYEKTKILGVRAKQINEGAESFIKIPDNVFDGYVIAEMELEAKKIPFIIKRPIPGGSCEFWNLKDLEHIHF